MKPFTCNVCNEKLETKKLLDYHYYIHYKVFDYKEGKIVGFHKTEQHCDICNMVMSNCQLFEHKHRYHVPWTGPICEDTGRVHDPTKRQPNECKKCGLWFKYDGTFAVHLHLHLHDQHQQKEAQSLEQKNEQTKRQTFNSKHSKTQTRIFKKLKKLKHV